MVQFRAYAVGESRGELAVLKFFGYTVPRRFGTYSIPISIQSAYLRHFAAGHGAQFALPITEFYIPGNYTGLLRLISSPDVKHIVCVSIYVFDGLSSCKAVNNQFIGREDIKVWCALENEVSSPSGTLSRLEHFRSLVKYSGLNVV